MEAIMETVFKVLIVILLVVPLHTSATNEDKNISMMTLELFPYGFMNDEGKRDGVLYKLMNEIIVESGVGKSKGVFPAQRLVIQFDKPKGMCTIVLDTPYVEHQLEAVEPIGYSLSMGILPKAGVKINSYLDLRSIIVAIPRGVYVDERFMKDKTMSKAPTSKYYSALQMLKLGRVDAIAGAVQSITYLAKNEEFTTLAFDKPLIFSENEMTLFCNQAVHQDIKKILKNTVIKLKENGKIKKILDKYFKSEANKS
ncbi:MAG: ABC transporter substrate-binding protein [Colwellia sp.]|nr:ABC transporter substrate-binding protein [Colwellia sp.]